MVKIIFCKLAMYVKKNKKKKKKSSDFERKKRVYIYVVIKDYFVSLHVTGASDGCE
jgi:hypothetical protein